MAKPDLKNGYLKIANEIIDAFAGIRISGEEMQCLWVILRKTYGWNKPRDVISLSQFMVATGLKKPSVSRALKRLLTKKLIIIKKDNATGTIYRLNKDLGAWSPLTKKLTHDPSLTKKLISDNKKVNSSLTKKLHTKDTITKDTITKDRETVSALPKPTRKVSAKQQLIQDQAQEVLDYFNIRHKELKPKSKGFTDKVNIEQISARLKAGRTYEECIKIVDNCAADPSCYGNGYFNPIGIFRRKNFERNLNKDHTVGKAPEPKQELSCLEKLDIKIAEENAELERLNKEYDDADKYRV